MTIDQYKKRYLELKKANKKIHVFSFNEQIPENLFKLSVFEVEITKDSLHKMAGKAEWTKNFIFEIGKLCGVETHKLYSNKLSDSSYLSSYRAERLLPSGGFDRKDGEYEFDAKARVEKEYWKERADNVDDPKRNPESSYKYRSEAHRNMEISNLSILGRSKADTGADKRAIIKVLQFPKPDYSYMGSYFFCFKCDPNLENPEMRRSIIASRNPAELIYGTSQIEAPPRVLNDDIIAEPTTKEPITSVEADIAFQIDTLKEHKAVCKIATIALEQGKFLDEMLEYVTLYLDYDKVGKVTSMIKWIAKFQQVDETVLNGDVQTQFAFITNWTKENK